jgi:hypothetical protein
VSAARIWQVAPGLLVLALLAACSSVPGADDKTADASSSRRCLGTPLQSHRVIDAETLLIEDSWGRHALLHMGSRCMLDDISPLKFTYNIGSGSICDRSDVQVTWGIGQAVPLSCIVSSVQPLSKEEAKAYDAPDRRKH